MNLLSEPPMTADAVGCWFWAILADQLMEMFILCWLVVFLIAIGICYRGRRGRARNPHRNPFCRRPFFLV